MKSDTERKKFYTEPLHLRKNRLHVHLSKDLRGKLKTKKRAVLLRKGDTVKILRGPKAGTTGKVSKVSVLRRKVFVEGAVSKTAKGKEVAIALEASNLLLVGLESTPERKEIFKDDAFIVAKKEVKKEEKKEDKKEGSDSSAKEKSESNSHTHASQKSAHLDTKAQEARAHAAAEKQHKNY